MADLTSKQLAQEQDYSFPYHYLDIVSDEDRLMSIEYLSYIKKVKSLLKTGKKILDIGCGDGRFCYEVGQNDDINISGLDYSERAIRFAKAFSPNLDFYCQDICNLNLPYKYDIAVLIETIEHFDPEKLPEILNNIAGILVDNGEVIITVPSTLLEISPKHYQHFTVESLTETLSEKFDVVSVTGYSLTGSKRKIFNIYRGLARVLYPFRFRLKLYNKLVSYLFYYYENNLAVGDPHHCYGLIAHCKKKNIK